MSSQMMQHTYTDTHRSISTFETEIKQSRVEGYSLDSRLWPLIMQLHNSSGKI